MKEAGKSRCLELLESSCKNWCSCSISFHCLVCTRKKKKLNLFTIYNTKFIMNSHMITLYSNSVENTLLIKITIIWTWPSRFNTVLTWVSLKPKIAWTTLKVEDTQSRHQTTMVIVVSQSMPSMTHNLTSLF